MMDQILGRPSPSLRRTQVFMVLFFWLWRLYKGDGSAYNQHRVVRRRPVISGGVSGVASLSPTTQRRWWHRVWIFLVGKTTGSRWMTRLNNRLKHFTPYQLILGTLTIVYALRHIDDVLGIGAPEPLARMYSRSFYRATYINTALDAGFATAMHVRPQWLKDIASVLLGGYYLVHASAGDEVLRRYRAFCSVEMLRTTWEKTNNPYLRFLTRGDRPYIPIVRHITIPRPTISSRSHLPSVKAMLFFAGPEEDFEKATEIIVDFPGGGFVSMGPGSHEERLRAWAIRTGKPVLSIDYGKAPEYPYPWAIEEGFDAYRTIMETRGKCLGITSGKVSAVLTGDSAGGNICTTIMNRILEHHSKSIPHPVALILAYPALDFNYTSWMTPANLRVLRTEQSETNIPGLPALKDHLSHKAPLSVVDDVEQKRPRRPTNASRKSWAEALGTKFGMTSATAPPPSPRAKTMPSSPIVPTTNLRRATSSRHAGFFALKETAGKSSSSYDDSEESDSDDDSDANWPDYRSDAEKSLSERVKTPGVHADERFTEGILAASPMKMRPDEALRIHNDEVDSDEHIDSTEELKPVRKAPIGTRLTMTSRVGYFQDRIISPSMMRAMAIMYIGPRRSPDFATDYYISPILSPSEHLAHFPPVYIICGERDPFVDDTVIFSGRIREAKRARRAAAAQSSAVSASVNGPTGETIPDHILRETDDDWVQMRIIEGWGHGFMQMTSVMREVDSILTEMADWIDESFERSHLLEKDQEEIASAHAAARAAFQPDAPVLLSPQNPMPSPLRSRHVKPVREYKTNPTNKVLGSADLGNEFGIIDADDDGMVTFTPKSKKRTPPPSQFTPVPRRTSRETINRSNSIPMFDQDDDSGSTDTSSVAMHMNREPAQPKGMRTFGLFSRPATAPNRLLHQKSPATALYSSGTGTPARRDQYSTSTSTPPGTAGSKEVNNHPLLSAAVASAARAASPALAAAAAAGLVPERVRPVTEAELLRRRRSEAVYGMGEVSSAIPSDEES